MAFLIGKYAGPARTFPTPVSILFISIRRLNEKILPQWRRSVIRERSVNMPTIDNAAQPLGTPREGLLARYPLPFFFLLSFALSLAAYGQSSPSSGTTSTSDSVLP